MWKKNTEKDETSPPPNPWERDNRMMNGFESLRQVREKNADHVTYV